MAIFNSYVIVPEGMYEKQHGQIWGIPDLQSQPFAITIITFTINITIDVIANTMKKVISNAINNIHHQ